MSVCDDDDDCERDRDTFDGPVLVPPEQGVQGTSFTLTDIVISYILLHSAVACFVVAIRQFAVSDLEM